MRKKVRMRIVLSSLIALAGLYLLQRLLMPKYASDIVEGAMIAEYYQEEKDHDVVFIGDCEVYENFSPQVLWDDFGINSYIRGSAEQLIWQSYYILEDTLRYETPKVVVFNVQSMHVDRPQREAYNRMTLDGMKWSWTKVKAIRASMTDSEHFLDYLFPVLRYHSRWDELSQDDIRYMFQTPKVSHNGYHMHVDVRPAEDIPDAKPMGDYTFGENAYQYLDRIVRLCQENDIQLVLVKAPSLYPAWYDEWERQIVGYARENDLLYINFLGLTEEIGLDHSMDTYDGGLHLNLSGAEKLTRYLGDILVKETDVSDRRDEPGLAERWEEKRRLYDMDAQEQYKELEERSMVLK